MKTNLLYTSLNVTAVAVALLCLCGTASVLVWTFLVILLVALKWERYMPGSCATAIWTASFFVFLAAGIFGAWKCGRGKLVCEAEKSRGQSFLLWETPAFLLFSLFFFISWRTDLDWPLAVGLCLPVVGLALALAFPFPRCRNGFWTAVRVLGFASALSVFGLGGLFLVWSGRTVSYRGNDPAALPSGVRWLGGKYIPEGAAEIRLEGTSAVCRWSCRISEKDFRKFMDGQWPGNRFIRYDGPMNPEDKGPFPYYLNAVYRRDGGSYGLRYDVKNQTMTGWYSHH